MPGNNNNNNAGLSRAIKRAEYKIAQRAKCYNANVRGVKPSNANAKACVETMKAASIVKGGRRTRRGGSRKSRRSTRRSWF
uniref:Uncharacterized protein n=1 Tax=viral metagenome TaxID=1070528 RepID=A0A6C0KYW9_9ZZZZ